MAKKASDKKTIKRNARKEIEQKISTALSDLKKEIGEKKFRAGLKKASKVFLGKLKKATPGKPVVAKVKRTKKKATPAAVVTEPQA